LPIGQKLDSYGSPSDDLIVDIIKLNLVTVMLHVDVLRKCDARRAKR
jgi:hypothetical protein